MNPWNANDLNIERKNSKALSDLPFDGARERYSDWRELLRNHLLACNHGFGRIIYETENDKFPIPWSRLAMGMRGMTCDLSWISKALRTFIVASMTLTFQRTCAQLIGGEEMNGIELWRVLFFKNQGGAEQVKLVDRAAFHAFPKCHHPDNIPQYLGLWERLRREHGQNLPEEHLKPMLLNFLPESTAADVRKNCRADDGSPPSTEDIIQYLKTDFHRLTDESVASTYKAKLFSTLPGLKPEKVHAVQEQPVPLPPAPFHDQLVNKLQEVINAVGQRTPPRSSSPNGRLEKPDAKWGGGCWHCGQPGHSRRGCRIFKDLIKKHNGLPDKYEGEYEKWARANKKKIGKNIVAQLNEHVKEIIEEPNAATSALASPPGASSTAKTEDTDKRLQWALLHGEMLHAAPVPVASFLENCTCASNRAMTCGVCSKQTGSPCKLMNNFHHLSEEDSDADDDEEAMVSALKTVAHKIRTGPKPHQTRTSGNKPKPLSKKQLDWVVAQVQAGKIELPQLEQLDDKDYVMVWALADSGSAAHVADIKKVFPGAKITESQGQKQGIQFQAADGGLLANRGEAKMLYVTPDGQRRCTVFQDAAVGMPILSITKIAEEDNLIAFHKRGGYIWHLPTNTYTKLVKRLGVYFVQLKVPKELANEGFHRPEP